MFYETEQFPKLCFKKNTNEISIRRLILIQAFSFRSLYSQTSLNRSCFQFLNAVLVLLVWN